MPNNSDILELKFLIRISNQTFLGYEFIILTPHVVCFDLIIFYVRCNSVLSISQPENFLSGSRDVPQNFDDPVKDFDLSMLELVLSPVVESRI